MIKTHHFLNLSRPRLMAIVNATPDSFSDGGELFSSDRLNVELAGRRIEQLIEDGAEIIDIGGESTRPGAASVSEQQELDRVIPVVEWVAKHCDVAISVDTSTPAVMREAALKGAHLINDVRALTRPGAVFTAAQLALPVCLMHMQGSPSTMQAKPAYQSVTVEVSSFLQERVTACLDAGLAPSKIWLDPGFGFGKTLEHNVELVRQLPDLVSLGFPLLVGFSRKSMVGQMLGRPLAERLAGSLALAMMALERGAMILRVHDIAATRDIIDTFVAIKSSS
ncbi:MAG: dihydropteroate synthase [Pseudohongiellaceae bacterium]|jgi:dihydropteroate synthase